MEFLGNSLFINSTYLKVVDLWNNQIKTVTDDAFVNLLDVEVIVLQKNLLTYLTGRVFRNNKKLTKILLHENNIHMLGPAIFDGLSKLKELNLEQNYCINESFSDYSKDISYVKKMLDNCFQNYAGSEQEITENTLHLSEDNKNSIPKIMLDIYGLIAIQVVFTLILIILTYHNFRLIRNLTAIRQKICSE